MTIGERVIEMMNSGELEAHFTGSIQGGDTATEMGGHGIAMIALLSVFFKELSERLGISQLELMGMVHQFISCIEECDTEGMPS